MRIGQSLGLNLVLYTLSPAALLESTDDCSELEALTVNYSVQ